MLIKEEKKILNKGVNSKSWQVTKISVNFFAGVKKIWSLGNN